MTQCAGAVGVTVGVARVADAARISLPRITASTFGRSDRFSSWLQNIAVLREAVLASLRNAQGDGILAQEIALVERGRGPCSGLLLLNREFPGASAEGALERGQFLDGVRLHRVVGSPAALGAEPFLQLGIPADIVVEKRFCSDHGLILL